METLTLGSAVVEVGADLTKLLKGFKDAKAARDAFDKDMVTGSNGLLKFEKLLNETGAALDKQATKEKKVGDEAKAAATGVDKLADANRKTADASKAASAALETEAQKNERLTKMVDASIAKLNERNRVTARGSAAALTVPRLSPAEKASVDKMMGTVGGKIPAGVLEGAAGAAGVKVTTDALKAEEKVVEHLSGKFKLNSTAIREMIVLMREAGRGDFTRMAGSASILGQNLGIVETMGAAATAGLVTLAATVAIVGVAFLEGSKEANQFANMLALTGNYAGLTATSYEDMAHRIADSTKTSVGSNKELISALAQTNEFTKSEIESLVVAADQLGKATGKSAEDVVKDFERMAEGPTKYAVEFQRTHIGIITPLQIDAIRRLEERGQKEEALAALIKIVTTGIAQHTVEQTGIIVGAWNGATTAVANFWEWLKRIGTDSTATEQIASLNQQIAMVGKTAANPESVRQYRSLVAQRDALVATAKATEQKADAEAKASRQTKISNDALETLHTTYSGLIDNQQKFTNDVARLRKTLADAEKANPNDPLVKQLRDDLPAAIEKLRKQDLPAAFKADAKAMREAESEAKRLARAAAALEKRRQDAITSLKDEKETLELVVPLYQDQSMSLDEVSRAKEITTALSKQKLSADSLEGKIIAELVGRIHDLNKAIADETKKREELLSIADQTASIEQEITLIGLSTEATVRAKVKLDALAKAKRDHIAITPEYLAAIEKEADAQAKAASALEKRQFLEETHKGFVESAQAIAIQAETLGVGRAAAAAYTREMELLNDAQAKHIALTPQDVAAINKEAVAYGYAVDALDRMNEAVTANKFANDELMSSLEDLIFSGKSFGAVLRSLVTDLAKAAFEATIFGEGPLAGVLGGRSAASKGHGLLDIFGSKKNRAQSTDLGLDTKQMNMALKLSTDELLQFSRALAMASTAAQTSGAGGLNLGGASSYPVGGSGSGPLFDDNKSFTGAYSAPLVDPDTLKAVDLGLSGLDAQTTRVTAALEAQVPALGQFGGAISQALSMIAGGGGGGGFLGSLLKIGGMVAGSINFGGLNAMGGTLGGSGAFAGLSDSITKAGPIGDAFSMPALVLHSGTSYVTHGAGPTRHVSPSTFVNAPRFHDGLGPGEFPAILEEGETVNPKHSRAAKGMRSIQIGDIHVHGVSDERTGRSTGRQVGARIQGELNKSRRSGY